MQTASAARTQWKEPPEQPAVQHAMDRVNHRSPDVWDSAAESAAASSNMHRSSSKDSNGRQWGSSVLPGGATAAAGDTHSAGSAPEGKQTEPTLRQGRHGRVPSLTAWNEPPVSSVPDRQALGHGGVDATAAKDPPSTANGFRFRPLPEPRDSFTPGRQPSPLFKDR